jgi:WD40 repeat protein
VHESFIVIGQTDSYVRVWPLELDTFEMEIKHEESISSVDVSSDSYKILCGTMYGSIGLLNRSHPDKEEYKTIVRSHTNKINELAFHVPL